MSRLDELKKQYPELNLSLFDLMVNLDTSDTYKYVPLFCKILGRRFSMKEQWNQEDIKNAKLEIEANLINKGFSTNNLTDNQLYALYNLADFWNNELFFTLKEFMHYMEKNQIENKDVTSYKSIDEIRGAITLASIKEMTKDLEGQIVKEFEDNKWVVIRPLTFAASTKYGASTRWCTTYQKEKQYFEKYWRRGILVYFINKQTGYKFAGFKGLFGDNEFSFWNAEDTRVDYLDIDADDYLFPIVRRIFKSEYSNKNLSSDEIQKQVHEECLNSYEKMQAEVRELRIEDMPLPIENDVQLSEELTQRLTEVARRINGGEVNMEERGEYVVMEQPMSEARIVPMNARPIEIREGRPEIS